MADISDVQAALVGLIASAIYPGGTIQPSACGVDAKVYQGWPVPNVLEADIAAHRAHVSVFCGDAERNTTRFFRRWEQVTQSNITLTAQASGQTVTLAGAVSVPQNVMLIVNGRAYGYAVQAADTLTTIAANLAGLIPGSSAAGAVITLPAGSRFVARVGGSATVQQEVGRLEKQVTVTVWADTPAARDGLAKLIISHLMASPRLPLADSTTAQVKYKGARQGDEMQRQRVYRRDIMLTVEYGVTIQQQAAQILSETTNVSAPNAPAVSVTS